MAGFELKAGLEGADAVRQALLRVAEAAPHAVARALYQQGVLVWAEAVRRAPVEYGILRSSGYAAPPVEEGGTIAVQVGFGVKYAIYQHEGEYQHPRGGERKYLENAVRAKASIERVAAWARENLEKGLGSVPLTTAAPARPKVAERARSRAALRRASARIRNKKG